MISEHRYGSFVTQIFPLIGVYLGLSLKSILILYSCSFNLFYLATALLLGFCFRNKVLLILFTLYLFVFVSDGFFWPNNEVHQGTAWSMIFFGLYQSNRDSFTWYKILIAVIVAFLAISSHLIVSISFLFLWIMFHLEVGPRQLLVNQKFIGFTILILFFISGRYLLSSEGWYDQAKLKEVNNISIQSIWNAFGSGQAQSFYALLFKNYWLSIGIFMGSLWILFKTKKFHTTFLYLGFCIGYFVLICITFPDAYGRDLLFYMESEWVSLALIIAFPLINFCNGKSYFYVFLCVILSIRLCYILGSYPYFNDRYKQLDKTVEYYHQKNMHKVTIIQEEFDSKNIYLMSWGLPVESILLTKFKNYPIQTTIKVVSSPPPEILTKDSFHSSFDIKPIQRLNTDYFNLDLEQNYYTITE